ncbi:MAG: MBL fold metallo-hydrolase [Treponema sp.]
MRIHFWGVRGSIATPLSSEQIQAKISAVVQRITAKDIEDEDSRERFLASLPSWLFGTVGGNTTCVEIETENGEHIIFDAGSGIRQLGIDLQNRMDYYEKPHTYHLFFTHAHWDHIQGLPFFNPAYDPRNTIIIYSPRAKMQSFLEEQMKWPYFPVTMFGKGGFTADISFHYIEPHERYVTIGDAQIGWHRVRHPGGCVAYSVANNEKKIIFSTDTELRPQDFERNDANIAFYSGVDLLIIDAQYTMSDSIQKIGWGHSTFSLAIDFANSWQIKKLALFHHEPTYNDKKILSIQENAQHYCSYVSHNQLEIFTAVEGKDFYI